LQLVGQYYNYNADQMYNISYKEAGCENVTWINLAQEWSNGGLL